MKDTFSNIDYSSPSAKSEVQALIDKGIDPSTANNWAIKNAALEGNFDVIAILLKDKRVDPSVDRNMPLKRAIKSRCTLCVRYLLSDERIRNVEEDLTDKEIQTFTFKRAFTLVKQEKSKKKIGKFADFLEI